MASFQGVGSKGKPLGYVDGKSFDLCRMLVLAKVETFPLLCLNKPLALCVSSTELGALRKLCLLVLSCVSKSPRLPVSSFSYWPPWLQRALVLQTLVKLCRPFGWCLVRS